MSRKRPKSRMEATVNVCVTSRNANKPDARYVINAPSISSLLRALVANKPFIKRRNDPLSPTANCDVGPTTVTL